jgi:hypothetical protein
MIEIIKRIEDPLVRLQQLKLFLDTNFFTNTTLEYILNEKEFEKLKADGTLIEVSGFLLNKKLEVEK